jgi:hypothetical protein
MLLDTDCVFFQKLYTDCVFFYKINVNCVFYLAVMSELTSARPSLLCYHCSDVVAASYGPLLQ